MASVFIESARFTTDIQRRKIMKRGHVNGDDEWRVKGHELVLACRDGRLDDVKRLVDEGVPLNSKYQDWWFNRSSPLWTACRYDHLELVRFLLDSGADPNFGKYPPLSEVCDQSKPNCLAIARLLLERGADVNGGHLYNLAPILTFFLAGHSPNALLELLIEKGANVNSVNMHGHNALSRLVDSNYHCAAFWMLENGSEVVSHEQQLMKMIVENNQHDVPRMIRLLRIAWERGVREIKDEDLTYRIILPPWNRKVHWIYSTSFHEKARQFMLVWNRVRRQYGIDKEIGLMVVEYMATHEIKTVYHGHV